MVTGQEVSGHSEVHNTPNANLDGLSEDQKRLIAKEYLAKEARDAQSSEVAFGGASDGAEPTTTISMEPLLGSRPSTIQIENGFGASQEQKLSPEQLKQQINNILSGGKFDASDAFDVTSNITKQ